MCVIDGTLEAYFRGRKLKGKEIKVPEGYTGAIFSKASTGNEGMEGTTKQAGRGGKGMVIEDDKEDDEEGEFQALEEVSSFNRVVLWGHESLVEGNDPFVKSVEEWIGFAEAVSPALSGVKTMLMGRV